MRPARPPESSEKQRYALARWRLAAALAAATPFVLDPLGMDRWVFPKELCLVVAAALAWSIPPESRMPRWWRWWLVVAGIAVTVTAASGAVPVPQILGRWPRYEGIITLGTYALAVALGARLWGSSAADGTPARVARNTGTAVLAAGLCLTALIASIEALGGRPLASDLERPGSLLGNASDLGVVGVVGLALFLPRAAAALASIGGRGRLVVPLSGAVASILVVALSASRGALLAVVVVFVLTAGSALRRRERRWRWWATLAGSAFAVATGALLFPLTAARVVGASPNAADSATNRWDLWSATLDLVQQHPVVGVGPNGFADALPSVLGVTWFTRAGLGSWTESPHDLPLQVLAAGGVVGAATALSFLLLLILHIRRRGAGGAFGGAAVIAVVGGGVALLTHMSSPGPVLLLCLVTGSLAAVPATQHGRSPWPRRVAAGALTAWGLALVLALAGDHAFGRGVAELTAGRPDDADRAFDTAALLRPWDSDVPLRAAELLASAADAAGTAQGLTGAAEWAERATRILPVSPRALLADAIIAQYSGDFVRSTDSLRRAVDLSPVDPLLRHRLGGVLLLSGESQSAVKELEIAASLAPTDVGIQETLAYARGVPTVP